MKVGGKVRALRGLPLKGIKKDGGISKAECTIFLSDTATLVEKCVVLA